MRKTTGRIGLDRSEASEREALHGGSGIGQRRDGDVRNNSGRCHAFEDRCKDDLICPQPETSVMCRLPADFEPSPAKMLRSWRRAVVSLGLALLSSCGGNPDFIDALDKDLRFYANTAVIVNPGAAEIRRGEQATAIVTVRYQGDEFTSPGLSVVDPLIPGVQVRLVATGAPGAHGPRPCVSNELPPDADPTYHRCYDWQIVVDADAPARDVGRITLAAQWRGKGGTIERLGYFDVRLVGLPAVDDFALAVVPQSTAYATQATTSIRVVRDPGFVEPVTLTLDNLGSGIGGSFSPNPVPVGVDAATLTLDIPARYAGGASPRLEVTGRSGALRKVLEFTQPIAALYTVTVAAPGGGTGILTRRQPLDLDVTIEFDRFGPFALVGPGRIDLSLPDPPPDVRAQWLTDAQPVSSNPATLTLRRTLRLTAEGNDGFAGNLEVRATAAQIPGEPFATASLPLQLDYAYSWEYVESDANYYQGNNDSIGIGLQSGNRPAVAWLEGEGEERKVYLKRFDGTAFLPSPPDLKALAVVGGRMEQARMAMARNDTAYVVFTYGFNGLGGARVGLGTASLSAANWIVDEALASMPVGQQARSPRIAVGRVDDAIALSFIVETGAPLAAGALLVHSRLLAGTRPGPLPEPSRADGAINASTNGYVLRDSPSIALRADGHPWLAWIEQEYATPARRPELWLRGHDGGRWSAPIRLTTRRPLVAKPTQLLVEPGTGFLVVAWLEGSPARLMLARVDPATGNFSELLDSSNPLDGALNVTTGEAAGDMALTFDQGRVVVVWTEGPPTRPTLYGKQRNADGTWTRLDAAIDSFRPTRSPFVVGDGTGRLYVTWAGYVAGTDPLSPAPNTAILVGRSVSP